MVIQTVYDQFLQSWYADVNDSSKLSVYHISNKIFKLEKYITDVENNNHRIALSRFRTSRING